MIRSADFVGAEPIDDDDDEYEHQHDENHCRCGFDVNDRFSQGEIQTSAHEHPDRRIVEALIGAGLLNVQARVRGALEIEDNGDGLLSVNDGHTGRPIFQLEACES
jgi:hypothetical protein